MLRTNLPVRRLLEMRKTPFMSRVKKNRGRRTPPKGQRDREFTTPPTLEWRGENNRFLLHQHYF
jgi:hypothetical protein